MDICCFCLLSIHSFLNEQHVIVWNGGNTLISPQSFALVGLDPSLPWCFWLQAEQQTQTRLSSPELQPELMKLPARSVKVWSSWRMRWGEAFPEADSVQTEAEKQDMELEKDRVLMISSESMGCSHHQPTPRLGSYVCQCILFCSSLRWLSNSHCPD